MAGDTQVTLFDRMREAADPLCWHDFFDRYWRTIFAYARRLGCQDQSADDVVQEVLLVVFEGREVFRYDPARGRFRDWLAAVVRNTVARRRRGRDDRVRRAAAEPVVAELAGKTATPGEDCQTAFENTLLCSALEIVRREVSAETYQAFELAVLHGVTGADIARVTGLSRNAVYKARARVLKRLQELGACYGRTGQLGEQLRRALRDAPPPHVHRSILSYSESFSRAEAGQ